MRAPLRSTLAAVLAAAFLGTAPATAGAAIYPGPAGPRDVHGDIEREWLDLGGATGTLGAPLTSEVGTPDGRGAYNVFERGSVYWSPASGAHEVLGAIRDLWGRSGWEGGPMGFPTTDEVSVPGGVYQRFQGCTAYWSPQGGAHWVCGDVAVAWGTTGWEHGVYGFPTTDEYATADGRGQGFRGGTLYWVASTRAVVGTATPPVYRNCTDVWNTLGRPIHTWDLGYSRSLDGDGDGVACEVRPRA